MEPEALRDFQGLVERVGGRQHLLLVGEARAGELETFARDLFAEPAKDEPPAAPPPPPPQPEAEADAEPEAAPAPAPAAAARRARVRGGGGGGRPWRGCPLLFALFRAGSLEQPRWRRERRRLREILRDVRGQLSSGPLAAVVGVVVLPPASPSGRGGGGGAEAAEEARLRLEALLRRVFRERRPPRPRLPDTLQAVAYRPGDARAAAAAREAACRALRAALKLRADGAESQKQKLPAFLWCIPWGRRDEHFHTDAKLNEDALQDLEEAIALTNIAPNGNCEEASGGLDS